MDDPWRDSSYQDRRVPRETSNNPPSFGFSGAMTDDGGSGSACNPALGMGNVGNGSTVGNAPSMDHGSGYGNQQPSNQTTTDPVAEVRLLPGHRRVVDHVTTKADLAAARQRRRGRAAAGRARGTGPARGAADQPQAPAKRLLAPTPVFYGDGSRRVPILSTYGGSERIEWVRIPEPPKPVVVTGWVRADPMQTPFFSTVWEPRKEEEPGDEQLRFMARLAQDRIQTEREDERMQQMLVHQQRQKRLKTGLDTLDGVIRDCHQRIDALLSATGSGQPRTSHTRRFEAPRNEMACQQNFTMLNQDGSLNLPPGTSSGTRRPEARILALGNAANQSSGATVNPFDLSRGKDIVSLAEPPTAKLPPLETIRLLRRSLNTDYDDDNDDDDDDDEFDGSSWTRPTYELKEFPFTDCPEYVALSYVWGSEQFTSTIPINRASIPVRTNLAEAISKIEKFETFEYLWADAICINQQDDEEKSRVVQHMGEIFANARSVYAWLGPVERATQYTSTADLFTHLCHLGMLFWRHAGTTDTARLNERSLDLDAILSKSYSALLRRFTGSPTERGQFPTEEYAAFSLRSFWRRIWVLQEVFLAKDLYYFCGDTRLTSKNLIGALILLEMFQRDIIRRESSPQERLQLTHCLRKFVHDFPVFPEMHRLLIYTSIYPPEVVSLRIAMTNFCVKELPGGSSATNPRDMIFGLLGFANDKERSYIRADYSKSVQDTYVDVTRALIQNGWTDILSWAQPWDIKIFRDLPSWVPDYTTTIYESLCSQWQAKPWLPRFKAHGRNTTYNYENAPPFEWDSRALPVYGRPVDEIFLVGKLWHPRSPRESQAAGFAFADQINPSDDLTRSVSYESLLAFLKEIEEFAKSADDMQKPIDDRCWPPETPRFSKDAKWRVPCCDQIVLDGRLVRGDVSTPKRYDAAYRGLKACIENPSANNQLPDEARPYFESMLHWTDKRPFLTKNGFVGLGPARIETGDIVAVLEGFNSVYLLREPNVSMSDLKAWVDPKTLGHRLIGEAYVNNLMDGEAVDPSPKRQPKRWWHLR
ncbi:heterokaryon incompatibility protein-domain-containing protein [Xylaria venustula]|nr:heterokaryon incompatibility protein-domain-containing protein [Xylaria venustula]